MLKNKISVRLAVVVSDRSTLRLQSYFGYRFSPVVPVISRVPGRLHIDYETGSVNDQFVNDMKSPDTLFDLVLILNNDCAH